MYLLYFADTMELAGSESKESRTIFAGNALSRTHKREVIAIFNGVDGSTSFFCRFVDGVHTLAEPFMPLPSTNKGGDDRGMRDEA